MGPARCVAWSSQGLHFLHLSRCTSQIQTSHLTSGRTGRRVQTVSSSVWSHENKLEKQEQWYGWRLFSNGTMKWAWLPPNLTLCDKNYTLTTKFNNPWSDSYSPQLKVLLAHAQWEGSQQPGALTQHRASSWKVAVPSVAIALNQVSLTSDSLPGRSDCGCYCQPCSRLRLSPSAWGQGTRS